MKTILVTAYAMNPYKGSEDGMGWNFVLQIARHHSVIAITRKNNLANIEKYIATHPDQRDLFDRIRMIGFDWPYLLRAWKKGPLLSMIYFYGWQFTIAIWLLFQNWSRNIQADIVHNLNFHNDWTPSFLWILGKPLIWGPVGHHPKIPAAFLRPVYGKKEYWKDRLLWAMKRFFWTVDPLLRLTVRKSDTILCMNSQASKVLQLETAQFRILPSVAAESALYIPRSGTPGINTVVSKPRGFTILSAGRFIPLKGFDLTIRSFAQFYRRLPACRQILVKLVLVGSGPKKAFLQQIIEEENLAGVVEIIEWIPREQFLDLYKQSHVFLFPSHEGAGMVVAEAMSHGLPVVCLKNAGPGEFISPASELSVPYGSYDETVRGLADRLERLYQEPDFYQHESRLALQRFSGYLRWDVRAGQLKEIYELACRKRREKQKSIAINLLRKKASI